MHTDPLHTAGMFLVKGRKKYLVQVHRKQQVNPLNHRQVLSKFGIHPKRYRGRLKMNLKFRRCCFLGTRHLSQSQLLRKLLLLKHSFLIHRQYSRLVQLRHCTLRRQVVLQCMLLFRCKYRVIGSPSSPMTSLVSESVCPLSKSL